MEINTKSAERIQGELNKDVDSLAKKLESVQKTLTEELDKRHVSSETTSPEAPPDVLASVGEQLVFLTQNMSSIKLKVSDLGRANNAISMAASAARKIPGLTLNSLPWDSKS